MAVAWSSQYDERPTVLPDGSADGEWLTVRQVDAPEGRSGGAIRQDVTVSHPAQSGGAPAGCPGIAPGTVPDKASPTAGRQMGES
ncbi:hypothetical protein [Bifidobacterium thermacidophilum]|uniref:hypothetical protein n=1 Tax=Bifidobacterium thermacidophilum TaxID=246618 RepID=UPI00042589DC|nr:hypothetical protein [Bifidobacterium thermacidophilum]